MIYLWQRKLARRIEDWKVIEDYTASDHQYITFRLRDVVQIKEQREHDTPRWNASKLNLEKLCQALDNGQQALNRDLDGMSPLEQANVTVETTMAIIHQACRDAVPMKSRYCKRRPVYWWTEEIAALRRKCLHLRRIAQRAVRNRRDPLSKIAEHKAAKHELRRAIKLSKSRSWKRLTEDLNNDPWGLGYKVVLRKLHAFKNKPILDTATTEVIVDTLFPTHPPRTSSSIIDATEAPRSLWRNSQSQ